MFTLFKRKTSTISQEFIYLRYVDNHLHRPEYILTTFQLNVQSSGTTCHLFVRHMFQNYRADLFRIQMKGFWFGHYSLNFQISSEQITLWEKICLQEFYINFFFFLVLLCEVQKFFIVKIPSYLRIYSLSYVPPSDKVSSSMILQQLHKHF